MTTAITMNTGLNHESRACRLPLVHRTAGTANEKTLGSAYQRFCEMNQDLINTEKLNECSMNITISSFLRQGTLRTVAIAEALIWVLIS